MKRILCHYHPGYGTLSSTFKHCPSDLPSLLQDQQSSSNHMLLHIVSLSPKPPLPYIEPLFGSISLFCLSSSGSLNRITETFYFDATPDQVRQKYGFMYGKKPKVSEEALGCVFSLPHDILYSKSSTFFLVFHVYKVTTGDTDTMLAYYTRSASPRDTLLESTKRMMHHQSPIAIGLYRLTPDTENMSKKFGHLTAKMFAVKSPFTMSDLFIVQYVTGADSSMTEPIALEIKFTLASLGAEENILPSAAASMRPEVVPRLLPAQLYKNNDVIGLSPRSGGDIVRLLPMPPHPSAASAEDMIRRMLSYFDNTLFLYPLTLERFQHRNLSLRIQLVVLNDPSNNVYDAKSVRDADVTVLTSVYDSSLQPSLCDEAFTKVFYHNPAPSLCDEIKIMLPMNLSRDHFLKITAYHLHVQAKSHGRQFIELGNAFFSLVSADGSLIEDKEYVIQLSPTHEMLEDVRAKAGILNRDQYVQSPIVRIRTRSLSSAHSSCPYVHSFLTTVMSYPLLPPKDAPVGSVPSESRIDAVTFDLQKANSAQVTQHFFVIIRQLLRVLCGGTRVLTEEYRNPGNCPVSRCSAFIALLQCFAKIAPHALVEVSDDSDDIEDRSIGEEFLRNYVDFLFDEEDLSPERIPPPPPSYADLDLIATFVAQQIEEVVLEDVIGCCVDDVKSVCCVDSRNISNGFRWWGLKKNLRFDLDKSWLEIPDKLEKLHAPYVASFKQMEKALFSPSSLETEGYVSLTPIRPLYDQFDGYQARKESATSQWQPFLHEIFVYQWCALLTILQGGDTVGQNGCAVSYPEISMKRIEEFNKTAKKNKDLRAMLLGHGPLVLRLIIKSLALRIVRESKRTPVLLDKGFQGALETLVELLSSEVVTCLTYGSWRSRKLNSALAQFIRSLFAIIAPIQAYQLVQAYFKRAVSRNEEVDLRIEFLDELSQYDQFVAINFPLPLYTSLTHFEMGTMFMQRGKLKDKRLPSIRGAEAPPAAWLIHMMIKELSSVSIYEKRTKTLAVGMMRDLLVRLSYEKRFQSLRSTHRIAIMLLPLLARILHDSDKLSEYSVDSIYRKEILALFLYIVQSLPEKHLRSQLRLIAQGSSSSMIHRSHTNALVKMSEFTILRFLRVLDIAIDTFDLPFNFASSLDASYQILVPTGSAIFDGGFIPKNAYQSLAQLDQLMHVRSGVRSVVRKKRATTVEDGQRKWKSHQNDMVCSVDDKKIVRLFSNSDMGQGLLAAKGLCHECVMITLKALSIILDDIPRFLFNPKEMVYEEPFIELVTMCVSVLLHCLSSNESEIAMVFAMKTLARFLRNFGGKLFLAVVQDLLQDWMRCLLELCGRRSYLIRNEACSLIVLLFQAVFHYNGSIVKLSEVTLVIFPDLIQTVLYSNDRSQSLKENFIPNLLTSIHSIRAECATKFTNPSCPPYPLELSYAIALRLSTLMEQLVKLTAATKYQLVLLPKKGATTPHSRQSLESVAGSSLNGKVSSGVSISSIESSSTVDEPGISPKALIKKATSKDFNDGASVHSVIRRTNTNQSMQSERADRLETGMVSPVAARRTVTFNAYVNSPESAEDKCGFLSYELAEIPEFRVIDTEFVLDLFLEVTSFFDPISCTK